MAEEPHFDEKRGAADLDVEKEAGVTAASSSTRSRASSKRENDHDEPTNDADAPGEIPAAASDPNIVDWDGPNDPAHPLNWPNSRKVTIIVLVSAMTFLSPLASSIFAPGTAQVLRDFHSDNVSLGSFTVSVFLLGYVFGPLVVAPLSEIYGRLPVYQASNLLFVVFNVACALAPNLNSLIAFRFLSGTAGSIPITVGAGSIADLFPREQRGKWMSAWVMGPLVGPVVGPIAGGFITQSIGWRWTFWVLSIAAGTILAFCLVFLKETYHPVLLERKAAKLRKETGNMELRTGAQSTESATHKLITAITRPTRLLFGSPIVFLLSLNVAIIYGYLYLLFTTFPMVFEEQYQFSQGTVGLSYLGIGVGSAFGLAGVATVSDRMQLYLDKKNGGQKPEHRLPPMVVAAFFVPAGLFWYGWTAYYRVHWMVPIIGTSFLGFGMTMTFMVTALYLVDTFTIYAASATAASTIARSLVGAVLPLAGPKMYQALGLGWGNSLLAFIAVALALVPMVFMKYGEKIRLRTRTEV